MEELAAEIKVETEEGSEILQSLAVPTVLDSSPFPSVMVEPAFPWLTYPFQLFFWTNQPY